MSSQLASKGVVPPSIAIQEALTTSKSSAAATRRARASSLVTVEQVGESHYQVLDQSAYVNPNAEWVNHKGTALNFSSFSRSLNSVSSGAWLMHPILILVGKICLDIFPGMNQQTSWTIVNLGYLAVNSHHLM